MTELPVVGEGDDYIEIPDDELDPYSPPLDTGVVVYLAETTCGLCEATVPVGRLMWVSQDEPDDHAHPTCWWAELEGWEEPR